MFCYISKVVYKKQQLQSRPFIPKCNTIEAAKHQVSRMSIPYE
jgi:hypothetical protein